MTQLKIGNRIEWELVDFGRRPDDEIAREIGCHVDTVEKARRRRGIAPFGKQQRRTTSTIDWDNARLGEEPDVDVADLSDGDKLALGAGNANPEDIETTAGPNTSDSPTPRGAELMSPFGRIFHGRWSHRPDGPGKHRCGPYRANGSRWGCIYRGRDRKSVV